MCFFLYTLCSLMALRLYSSPCAFLQGVDRAFPYVSTDEVGVIIESQTPVLFKLVHSKNFNVGVQSLMLLDKISSKNKIVSDRFYRALYSKLLLPSTMNSSKARLKCLFGLLLGVRKNNIKPPSPKESCRSLTWIYYEPIFGRSSCVDCNNSMDITSSHA
ncbi:protein SLOW WALKER 2 isoform X1 [Raphanus sativus]|uniref:Protein SLOW WALKER 2 isoform X1 n=1 Tax=Raphanus sativus TaxID=3726 RepID=A0A6J0MBN5_RAPSA|nr:protein SLOW WALKER 2 isoform X1 [Raphanus sativus]